MSDNDECPKCQEYKNVITVMALAMLRGIVTSLFPEMVPPKQGTPLINLKHLTIRPFNALRRAKITTIEEAIEIYNGGLPAPVYMFGKKSMDDLEYALRKGGYVNDE